ncbi:MAG: RcnB family protein [Rhodanobacter sp.]
MKKLLCLSMACGVMLALGSGSLLAQDHGHGNGHGNGHHQDDGDRGQAYGDGGAPYMSRDDDDDHGHGHGHAYGHYKDWRDRGRHEGWYKRGGYLPVDYRSSRYVVYDWRAAHLREPPRGYHWVRSDDGDFLLVAITTGVIVDLLLNH